MALTPDQLTLVAEIVREPYASVVSTTSSLNPSQESLLSDDIDLWEAERNSGDFKFKGDGVELDSRPLLADVFYRVRRMLGYPFILYDLNGPTMELIELEVGQNLA
jgi:hypothetical protein